MTLKNKVIFSIIFVNSIILFSLITTNFYFNEADINKTNLTHDNLNLSKNFGKIFLNGTLDWVDFRNAGNCTGSGTYSDPYVIEDLIIDGGSEGSCIWIENSDVYFRIENCSVFNSGDNNYTMDAAIKLNNVSNGYLRQNIITDSFLGIHLFGENNSISQNLITNNYGGIAPFGPFGANNFISQNSITNNLIGSFAGVGCTILKNNITHNRLGILCQDFSNISSNNISYNDMFGIWIYWGMNNTINDNLINNNNGTGILIKNGANNKISKNECINNKINGIHLQEVWWNHEISENIILNNDIGILLNFTEDTRVIGNIINNNRLSGIELNGSIYCDILDNQINENYYGIKLKNSDLNYIVQNIINYNHYGISLISSHNNDIVENTLHYNRICFTETDDCTQNHFIDNDCIELGDQGLTWIILIVVIGGVSIIGIIILLLRRKRA